jgi:hypothetical protein
MTAQVVISEGTGGLMVIELIKNGRALRSMRFMSDEWEDLVKQIASTKHTTEPIDVLMAKYRRLHNAGMNCTPLAQLLESMRDAKEDPEGMIEREQLQKMMEVIR